MGTTLCAALLGLLFGFVGSIPAAGPLAWLVVASGLERDAVRARRLAVGGALAESLWALVAFLGLGEALQHGLAKSALQAAGALFCVGLGVAWLSRRASPERPTARRTALLGFSLVALNPAFAATWAGFAALATSSGALVDLRRAAVPVALGAFVGIVLWFEVLYRASSARRAPLSPRAMGMASRALGAGLLLFGVWLAGTALLKA